MGFYLGQGAAFWKPSPEGPKDTPDPLAIFPSEPHAGDAQASSESAVDADNALERFRVEGEPAPNWEEIEGLAVHLSQTCGRIVEIADRTEEMLCRVERLAASTTIQLERTTALHPRPRLTWRTVRERAAHRLTEWRSVIAAAAMRARDETQTQWLVARVKLARGVQQPLRHARVVLRKRVIVAGLTTTEQAGHLAARVATTTADYLAPNGMTIVIRAPQPSHGVRRPALMSASSAVVFATFVALLVMTERLPLSGTSIPAVSTPPMLAAVVPIPAALDAILASSREMLPKFSVPTVSAPAAGSATTAHAPAQHPFVGTLTVESEPAGASVFINQSRVGQTPLTLPDLRAGSRVVWVESDGYQRWSASVLVPADKTTKIGVRLQRDPQHR